MGLILDTNLTLELLPNAKRNVVWRARRISFPPPMGTSPYLSLSRVAEELACSQSTAPRTDGERLCSPYPVLPWTREVSWQNGELYRSLASQGRLIGTNDLWIAATALVHAMGVVTKNIGEFQRVLGLSVLAY